MKESKKINNKADKEETKQQQTDSPVKEPGKEIGGPKGPEPTRYGDWEKKGRCIDF